jgi:phosphatidylglycerol:prolipoprotein diacylglycerol transferase
MWQYFSVSETTVIPAYNLFVGMGIAVGMLYLQYEKQFTILSIDKKNTLHSGILLSIVIGFIGAFTFDAYTKGIVINFNNLNQIGLTLLGGIVSGFLTLTIFLKLKSIPIYNTLNLLTPAFCLAHILGRVGCFFAGCCFGTPTDSPLGVKITKNSLAHLHFHEDVHVHPTQLYESFFILLVFLVVKQPNTKYKFSFYIIAYSIFRFFLEFIRADDRGILFNQSILTPSQFISLTIVIGAIVLTYLHNKKTIKLNLNS